MDDFGRIVEQAADTVAAEIADDAVAMLFGKALDRMRNVTKRVACARLINPAHHRFVSDFDQPLGFDRHIADEIGTVGIAVPAINNRGDIDIDDIAVTQRLFRRNTVTDDVIDRCATAVRVAPIIERRGRCACIKRHLPNDIIDGLGRDARHDMGRERVKYLCGKQTRLAHPRKAFGAVEFDNIRARMKRIGGHVLIMCHAIDIATIGELCERRSCRYGTGMTTRIYTAALAIIGDEILSGRTQDKNIAQIALWLNIQGIRLAEVRVVPDVEDAIVEAVNALRARNDYLFTTGGIGPTHDDITVDSIAKALGVPVVIHPQARAVLEGYYEARGGLTEARLRMARVPEGASLIANRMSGAPGIHVDNIFIMAGVPHITAGMLDALTGTLEGGAPMLSRTIGCWVAESEIADMLGATEKAHAGCQIGSYPFFREGRVGSNFVVRSTEQVALDACALALVAALAAGGREAVEGGI